jgi:hypothetical protein
MKSPAKKKVSPARPARKPPVKPKARPAATTQKAKSTKVETAKPAAKKGNAKLAAMAARGKKVPVVRSKSGKPANTVSGKSKSPKPAVGKSKPASASPPPVASARPAPVARTSVKPGARAKKKTSSAASAPTAKSAAPEAPLPPAAVASVQAGASKTPSRRVKSTTPPEKAKPATRPVRPPTVKAPTKRPIQAVSGPARALVELPPMAKPAAKKKLGLKIPALLLEGDETPGAHPGGPGSRYALGLPGVEPGGSADELRLPSSYGTRKLWLVPRDPQWLYAHWDFDDDQQREYNQLSRDGHMVLRVFGEESPAEVVTEIHVHPESRSWFAHVGRGGGRYFAVLGFRDRTGDWNEISRSGIVGTPPDSLSEEVEAEFVTLPTAAVPDAVPASPEVTGVELVADVIEAVRDYLAGEPAMVRALTEIRPVEHPSLSEPIQLPPPAEFIRWTPEQQHALAEVLSMEAVRHIWGGTPASSIAVADAREEQRRKDLASAAAVPAAPGEAAPGGGAISSPQGGPPSRRSFWFNVNAELVIYGATEPRARVVIGDRPIKLRKDGTFSYRFALPDGWYGLPISATAPDGEETRIALLRFMRETDYEGDVGAHPQDPSLKSPDPEHTS